MCRCTCYRYVQVYFLDRLNIYFNLTTSSLWTSREQLSHILTLLVRTVVCLEMYNSVNCISYIYHNIFIQRLVFNYNIMKSFQLIENDFGWSFPLLLCLTRFGSKTMSYLWDCVKMVVRSLAHARHLWRHCQFTVNLLLFIICLT